jgi:hypothetical protein
MAVLLSDLNVTNNTGPTQTIVENSSGLPVSTHIFADNSNGKDLVISGRMQQQICLTKATIQRSPLTNKNGLTTLDVDKIGIPRRGTS